MNSEQDELNEQRKDLINFLPAKPEQIEGWLVLLVAKGFKMSSEQNKLNEQRKENP